MLKNNLHLPGQFRWRIMLPLAVLLLGGCSYFGYKTSEEYAAKVGNKIFPLRELLAQLPAGLTRADSLARANDILNRWVKKELMLQLAEDNLQDNQRDLSRELEEYRSALLIHRYQQQLLSQKLDTAVTETDIKNYYDGNPEKFILPGTIVKAVYVEVPKNLARTDQIRRWMTENSQRSMSELESFSFQYASKYDHFNNDWVELNTILARIPGINESPEQLLKRSRILQFSDMNSTHFVLVNDYILAGEKAPFNFVRNRIESLILNTRKMELLQDLEKNVFEKAKRENSFTIKDFK